MIGGKLYCDECAKTKMRKKKPRPPRQQRTSGRQDFEFDTTGMNSQQIFNETVKRLRANDENEKSRVQKEAEAEQRLLEKATCNETDPLDVPEDTGRKQRVKHNRDCECSRCISERPKAENDSCNDMHYDNFRPGDMKG